MIAETICERSVGASTDRSKYGNKVLRWYLDRSMNVTPVNPKAPEVEGLETIKNLHELSKPTETAVSVITPPAVTLAVLKDAEACRIPFIWLQPGKLARSHCSQGRPTDGCCGVMASSEG